MGHAPSVLAFAQRSPWGVTLRRIIAGAAVAIVSFLFVVVVLWAPAVPLLTGVSAVACYAGGEAGATGPLLPDLLYGTSFKGQAVMWPDGFSARRAGGQVEVLNASRQVGATTGRVYHISTAPGDDNRQVDWAFPAAARCPYPWDFVDCGPAEHPFAPSDLGKQFCDLTLYP